MIVAIKEKDKVVLGVSICDACIDMTDKDLAHPDNLPLRKLRGTKDCYMAMDTISLLTDALRYNDSLYKDFDDQMSIIENLVSVTKKLCKVISPYFNNKEMENRMVIVKDNRLYSVDSFFNVWEVDDFLATTYDDYYMAAFETMKDLSKEDKIVEVSRKIERLKNRKLFPMTILDTSTGKKKVYYK